MASRHAFRILAPLLACFALLPSALASRSLYPGAFGDPHFTGWDGVNFDFTGEPGGIYCMVSDSALHINMKLEGRLKVLPDGRSQMQTWIKSIGILFKSHRVTLSAAEGADLSHARSFLRSIEVDGHEISVQKGAKFETPDNELIISYDRSKHHKVTPYDSYTVSLAGSAKIRLKVGPENPDLRTKDDVFFHFSVEMIDAKLTPEVHGVLGQTLLNAEGRRHGGSYRTVWNPLLVEQQVDGPNGDGYLDGSVSDYASSGLLYSDCRFSRFDANAENGKSRPVEVSSGYSRRFFPGFSRY